MYHKQVYFLLNKDTYLRFSVPPFKEAKSKYELKNSNYLFVICKSSLGFVNWMSVEWVVSKTKSSRFFVTYKMFMPRFYWILKVLFQAYLCLCQKRIFLRLSQSFKKLSSSLVYEVQQKYSVYTKKQTRITNICKK